MIHSTARRNISGFQSGKRKVLAQGQLSVVYSTLELYLHADTIVCGYNCIVMHCTGKECDATPYTDTYDIIKAMTIIQAATAYDNPETGDTTILLLNKAT